MRWTLVLLMSGCVIQSAVAEIHVPVRVVRDGKSILEGSFGVDGGSDADEIWEMFVKATRKQEAIASLKETKHFKPEYLKEKRKSDGFTIRSAGDDGGMRIEVSGGGMLIFDEVTVVRVKPNYRGKDSKWGLDPIQLESATKWRYVSRGQFRKK